jgi:hypothetical protein
MVVGGIDARAWNKTKHVEKENGFCQNFCPVSKKRKLIFIKTLTLPQQ